MHPTIRQLEYAVAVADRLSFHAAASVCGVTQPGLSAQIRQLEEMLDLTLFERGRRGVIVTDAGKTVVAHARRVLAEVGGLTAAARSVAEPLSGDLRIGVIPTVAPYVLPRLLPSVRERFPRLRPLLHEGQTEDIVARTEAGEIDLCLLAEEADLGSLETASMFDDPFLVLVGEGHRLARRKRIREEELAEEQVLLLDDGHCLRDQALHYCAKAGAAEVGDLRATSLNTLVEMVAAGLGVTLIPLSAVSTEVGDRKDLKTLRFASSPPARTIAAAWRPGTARKADLVTLVEAFRELVG